MIRLPAAARGSVVLAVVAAVLLSVAGCESKVGAAAVVGGNKISESDVTDLVSATADQPSTARSTVLSWLIRRELWTEVLKRKGGVPADSELATYHDVALSNLLQAQTSGSAADSQLQTAVSKSGLKSEFATVVVRAFELELALAKKLGVNSAADIITEIDKQQIGVSVSPRFGSWNSKELAVADVGKSQLPPGVSLSTTLPGDQTPSAQPSQ